MRITNTENRTIYLIGQATTGGIYNDYYRIRRVI